VKPTVYVRRKHKMYCIYDWCYKISVSGTEYLLKGQCSCLNHLAAETHLAVGLTLKLRLALNVVTNSSTLYSV
jgi:hypothetical protein